MSAGASDVADDEPSPLAVWLPAYARWLGAPAPAQVDPLDGVQQRNDELVVYSMTEPKWE